MGGQGVVVDVGGDTGIIMTIKLDNGYVVTTPPAIEFAPQYGIKNESGYWLQRPDGMVLSGTKAEMCALWENKLREGVVCRVEALPTEQELPCPS